MIATYRNHIAALLIVGATACAGNPIQMGVYTPKAEDEVLAAVHKKVIDLGYTVARMDSTKHEIVAQRMLNPPVKGADREEMFIQIGEDITGSTKLSITTSRVLPASADRPVRRIAASSKTNADANAVINLYMKVRRSI